MVKKRKQTDPTELAQRRMPANRIAAHRSKVLPPTLKKTCRRHGSRKDFAPTSMQIGQMIAGCLPTEEAATFVKLLRGSCEEFRSNVETTTAVRAELEDLPTQLAMNRSLLGYLSKCPIACIEDALQGTFPDRLVYITHVNSVDDFICGSDSSMTMMGSDKSDNVFVGGNGVNQSSWLKFYMLDCLLNQSLRPAWVPTTTKADKEKACDNLMPVPKKVVYSTAPFVSADGARCVVIAVPDAGCFYSSHEKLSAPSSCQMDGEPVGTSRQYIPLDIAWLRIRRDIPWSPGDANSDPWFCKGGYVNHLLVNGNDSEHIKPSAWKVVISHQKSKLSIPSSPITVLRVNQVPSESLAPLPPDVFLTKGNVEAIPANIDVARLQYKAKLEKSPSSKGRCRHYVAGALHRKIPQGAFIVRPVSDGDFDFIVSIKVPQLYTSNSGPIPGALPDESKFAFMSRPADNDTTVTTGDGNKWTKWVTQRESVVKVRYLNGCMEYTTPLVSIRNVGEGLRIGVKNKGSCRAGYGDLGKMYPLGSRVTTENKEKKVTAYKCTMIAGPLLVEAVSGLHNIGRSFFPSALRSLQDSESMYGLTALEYMEKLEPKSTSSNPDMSSSVTLTIDCSHNLSNSSHYDVNDGSVGYAVWTESSPGSAKNWYFILPSVYGETPTGEPFSGLAIELSHGIAIQWDGRVVRHCTSIMQTQESNHVYGTFCAAKTKLVDFGLQSFHEEKLRQEMIANSMSEGGIACNIEDAEASDCSAD